MRPRCKKRNGSGKEPCDICNTPFYLDEHHIRGRNIPNAEHMSNIANICPNCHRLIHVGDIILEGWFKTTSGHELIYHKPDEAVLVEDAIVYTY